MEFSGARREAIKTLSHSVYPHIYLQKKNMVSSLLQFSNFLRVSLIGVTKLEPWEIFA